MPKSNQQYDSVSAMLRDVANADSALTATEFEQHIADRKLVKDLAIARSLQRLTQEDVAKKVGRSQSWVSKLEHGADDELTIGDLRAYLSALGLEFRPGAMKQGATLVEEIKFLSFAIKDKLTRLAEMAKEGDGMTESIADFFCEAFHNINRLLAKAADQLPRRPDNRPYISIVAVVEGIRSLEEDAAAGPSRRMLAKHPALK